VPATAVLYAYQATPTKLALRATFMGTERLFCDIVRLIGGMRLLLCYKATLKRIAGQRHDRQLQEVNVGKEARVDMHDIPETGFLRLPQVLSVIPLGKTSWWNGVRSGRFPKPVKLSARCTAWRAEDIRELIKHLSETASHH
jgi:prophage regulatory protein